MTISCWLQIRTKRNENLIAPSHPGTCELRSSLLCRTTWTGTGYRRRTRGKSLKQFIFYASNVPPSFLVSQIQIFQLTRPKEEWLLIQCDVDEIPFGQAAPAAAAVQRHSSTVFQSKCVTTKAFLKQQKEKPTCDQNISHLQHPDETRHVGMWDCRENCLGRKWPARMFRFFLWRGDTVPFLSCAASISVAFYDLAEIRQWQYSLPPLPHRVSRTCPRGLRSWRQLSPQHHKSAAFWNKLLKQRSISPAPQCEGKSARRNMESEKQN